MGRVFRSLNTIDLPNLEGIRRERARRGLLAFTQYTFDKYEANWHHEILSRKLDDWVAGRCKRLLVFQPPRTGKSELVSRRLPAYIFGRRPEAQVIAASYSAELAGRMSIDVQRIMSSPAYGELFPNIKLPRARRGEGQATQEMFDIVGTGGYYRAAGVGGGITGMGAHYGIIDDPIKNRDQAYSAMYRESLWEWYRTTFFTRLEKDASLLLTMTRWHHDDLSGRLLDFAANLSTEPWEVICFPHRYEVTDLSHPQDLREPGEVLWPDKFDDPAVREMEVVLGPVQWAALHQQRPTRDSGALFQTKGLRWCRHNDEAQCWELRQPDGTVKTVHDQHMSFFITADLAVSLRESADYTVIGVFGQTPDNDLMLVHLEHERIEGPDQIPLISSLLPRWRPRIIGIERTQYQLSLVQAARRLGWPVLELTPKGDKVARATPAAVRWNSGTIYLGEGMRHVDTIVNELTSFPAGAKDDIVDVVSYAAEVLMNVPAFAGEFKTSATMTRPSYWSGR